MHTCHHQFPKGFAHKLLTLLEPFDDKAQRGKLTRTIADHAVAHGLREAFLQAQRLKACKRCASLTIALFRRIRRGICQDWVWRFDKRLLSRSYFNFIKSFGSGSEEKKKMKKLFFTQYFRPFAITIRPNDQLLTRSNLAHQRPLYVLVIFGRFFVQRRVK